MVVVDSMRDSNGFVNYGNSRKGIGTVPQRAKSINAENAEKKREDAEDCVQSWQFSASSLFSSAFSALLLLGPRRDAATFN